jgi:hypothetical protein
VDSTTNLDLEFDGTKGVDLKAWTDAEWGRDKKQPVVSTSSTEAEYLSLFTASPEATYQKGSSRNWATQSTKGFSFDPTTPVPRPWVGHCLNGRKESLGYGTWNHEFCHSFSLQRTGKKQTKQFGVF